MIYWAAVSRPDADDESLLERATHDLLNPVASILGLGETLRSRGASLDDATLRKFGASISRQSARLEAAVRDLIRATRLMRGDLEVTVGTVGLDSIVAAVHSERVRVDVPADATVSAEPLILAEVLVKLVDNALEHSSEEVVVRGGPGWIEVADRGTGFNEEGLARAFEPLSGGANVRGERGSGLGLGLFIARRLVEAMGGTLTAKSVAGEGSTFRIELPG